MLGRGAWRCPEGQIGQCRGEGLRGVPLQRGAGRVSPSSGESPLGTRRPFFAVSGVYVCASMSCLQALWIRVAPCALLLLAGIPRGPRGAHVQPPPCLPAAVPAQLPRGPVVLNYPALNIPAQNTRTFAVGTAEVRGESPLLCAAHRHFPISWLCFVALTARGCGGELSLPNLHLHPPAARLSPRDTVLSCPEPSAVFSSASFWPRLHSRPAFKGYFTSKTEKVHTMSVPKRNDP